jgi:choice-of-anchor A domain-containing protein
VNNSLAYYNCRTIETNQVKAAVIQAKAYLKQASQNIGALATTGTVSIADGGVLVIEFAAENAVQVIQLDAALLSQFWTVELRGYNSAKSFLVINVVGASGLRIENKNLAGLDATRTLWNLPEHSGALIVRGIELLGSLLAPESDLVPSTGVIVGQTIVRSNGFAAGENLLSRPYSALQFNHAVCVGLPIVTVPDSINAGLAVSELPVVKFEGNSSGNKVAAGFAAATAAALMAVFVM